MYNINQKPGETDIAYYRRLAKVADQRLVRLEALSHEKNYNVVKQWSYAKAQQDIRHWSSKGTRFNTAPPKTKQQLLAKIGDIKNFLESPTSTKRTITGIYQKRADTTNRRYGTNFTWSDIATFYNSEHYKNLSKRYGSDVITMAIADIQKSDEETIELIKKNKEVNIKASDEMINEVVNDVLAEMGTDLSKLF